ncbi:arsenate reductase (glutaredoxin) [Sphingomonas rosea]|uniref:Arsenate reductase n=1 Tax=Sphingomonas rosea TaxID=335605 RepID=A0ABP7UCE5_9SPHN
MDVTIFHNPACGTSRNVLGFLRERGIDPRVVEYLKTPPSRDEVRELARQSGGPLRDLLREKGTPFAELGLGDESLTDAQLLDAVQAHPILLNRPIVVIGDKAKLCRPSETVLAFLDDAGA